MKYWINKEGVLLLQLRPVNSFWELITLKNHNLFHQLRPLETQICLVLLVSMWLGHQIMIPLKLLKRQEMPSLKKELHLTLFRVQWRSKWKTIWVRYLNLQIQMLDQRKQVLNITSLQTQLRRPSRWCSHSLLTREMVHLNLLSKETLYIQRKTYFTILVQELITQLNHKTK